FPRKRAAHIRRRHRRCVRARVRLRPKSPATTRTQSRAGLEEVARSPGRQANATRSTWAADRSPRANDWVPLLAGWLTSNTRPTNAPQDGRAQARLSPG